MKLNTTARHVAYQHNELPHHNPCAQCGTPIAQPTYAEGDAHRMSYVWSCDDCGYEFTTLVMYPHQDDHKIAA